ncbi:hypothetical protein GGS20DRAFT_576164 [Poronia punctata]|nr:hypothetical protein GGS20DRAFT_576164 [Poronia punctata]
MDSRYILSETTDDTTANSPRVNAMVADDKPQSPAIMGSDSEGLVADSTSLTLKLVEEMKLLQRQLSEFEKNARPGLAEKPRERKSRPVLDKETLETEWERARAKLGMEEEMRAWRLEAKQRKAGLVAADPFQLRQKLGHRYDHDPSQHNANEDFAYNVKLFKLRQQWEQKMGTYVQLEMALQMDDTDSDDTDDTGYERDGLQSRIMMATAAYHREKEYIEREFEERQLARHRRRTRKAQLEQARDMRGHLPGYGESRETATKVAKGAPAGSKLIRAPWSKFKALRAEKWSSGAIDVLIGEPIIKFKTFGLLPTMRSQKAEIQAQERKTASKLELASEEPTMPERIRINSPSIRRNLLAVFKDGGRVLWADTMVFIRPYRALAYHDQAIRRRYKKIKAKLENRHDRGPSDGHPAAVPDDSDALNVTDDTAQGKPINTESSPVEETAEGEKGEWERDGNDEEEEEEEEASLRLEAALPVSFEDMKCFVEFLDNDLKKRITYLESSRCQTVAFSDLWYLFQPGSLVIGNDGKQAYRILSMNSVVHKATDPWRRYMEKFIGRKDTDDEEGEAAFTIKCVYVDFDGRRLGPVSKFIQIPLFEREVAVTTLPIYPLRFHPFQQKGAADNSVDLGDKLKQHLVQRGRMFLKVAAPHQANVEPMYYSGPAVESREPRDEIESQVVVDFEAAFKTEHQFQWEPELETLIESGAGDEEEHGVGKCVAACCGDEAVYNDSYIEKKMNEDFMAQLLPKTPEERPSVVIIPRTFDTKAEDAGLGEDDLAILSYRVFGYVLRSRKWAQLDLTYLSRDQPSGTIYEDDKTGGGGLKEAIPAFDQLVLPPGHKDMILSLITQHFRDKAWNNSERTDIVRGKGKGLIILLHGAPGVGKTTTAEGVAEKFKKPLFQLTCGDLGTTARDVELALETNFALASRWGCVLLLDEADVFLAQRTKEDFKRNGLVAVFLRVLEYYSGVLFLTTNRVGDFDEAFASRIHVSLYYPELGRKETLEVFKLNLKLVRDRFRSKSGELIIDDMDIGVFAQDYWDKNPFDHWNGRQIRNACQTAAALAEYEALGKDNSIILVPDPKIQLKVSHFETVAEAYLAFSKHLKDIYGTHTARRAKEAGLRAMWVNEKGEPMGNIGPKEAGALKVDRRSRFHQKSHGQYVTAPYEQQNQMRYPTTTQVPYRAGQMVAQGGSGSGQGYNVPPHSPHIVQPHPTRPSEYLEGPYMAHQHSNLNLSTQHQGQRMGPRHQQGQEWDDYHHSGYGHDQQQHEAAGRRTYFQPPEEDAYVQNRSPTPGGQTRQYDHDDYKPDDDMHMHGARDQRY